MTSTARIARPSQIELDAQIDWTAPYADLIDAVLGLVIQWQDGGPLTEDEYLAAEELAEDIVAANAL